MCFQIKKNIRYMTLPITNRDINNQKNKGFHFHLRNESLSGLRGYYIFPELQMPTLYLEKSNCAIS